MSDRMSLPDHTAKPISMRHALIAMPIFVFVALMLAFGWGLMTISRDIPSPLIGRQIPDFELQAVQGRTLGLSSPNLVGDVSLVNVFASWCTACRLEHPLLMQLSEGGQLAIHGLNYKDKPDHAAAWLGDLGDPYERTGADLDGRVSIDWGVYGVPETYVISPTGKIAYKHIGPVTKQTLDKIILPLVGKLRRQEGVLK